MTFDELSVFLADNPTIEWRQDDDGNLYLRHSIFDQPHEKVKINERQLEQILINGRNVEHITRVTGYFSKVSGWNKGKRGELADRHRVLVSK